MDVREGDVVVVTFTHGKDAVAIVETVIPWVMGEHEALVSFEDSPNHLRYVKVSRISEILSPATD